MNIDSKEIQNDNKGTASNLSNPTEDHQEQSANERPKKDLIMTYLRKFLQQQSDFIWLTQPYDRVVGSDHFQNLVVRSTFPVTLDQNDFEYYIDMTFNDFPINLRTRMKDLYHESNHNPISEDIIFTDHADGAVSATLVQIFS
jgi:hypothetical protein